MTDDTQRELAGSLNQTRQPSEVVQMSEQTLLEDDILVCPFCGKPPFVEPTGFHLGGRTIRCETDECMGPHTTAANVHDAVKQWNTRATPPVEPPSHAEREGLADALETQLHSQSPLFLTSNTVREIIGFLRDTPQPHAEREPVAWRWRNVAWETDYWAFTSQEPTHLRGDDTIIEPLYASPTDEVQALRAALTIADELVSLHRDYQTMSYPEFREKYKDDGPKLMSEVRRRYVEARSVLQGEPR